jgi:hypothetical protein
MHCEQQTFGRVTYTHTQGGLLVLLHLVHKAREQVGGCRQIISSHNIAAALFNSTGIHFALSFPTVAGV